MKRGHEWLNELDSWIT